MREVPTELTCTRCRVVAAMPAPGDFRSMWDAGWRWRGNPDERPTRLAPRTSIFSCPNCPPVIS